MLMACHGTKKSRQNGPNTRMTPTLSPEGQTLNVRRPRMLTPSPMEPDCPRIRSSGSSVWFGYLAMSRNQPDNTARIVVTASHSAAKNNGKKSVRCAALITTRGKRGQTSLNTASTSTTCAAKPTQKASVRNTGRPSV